MSVKIRHDIAAKYTKFAETITRKQVMCTKLQKHKKMLAFELVL